MADYRDDDFEWDLDKAADNLRDHGVSFHEAREVFDDPRYVWLPDELHSVDEDHYRSIGFTRRGRILAVIYCERGPRRRIISAWKASPHQRDAYEAGS
jgi:uncharacterized DUF497 family protein